MPETIFLDCKYSHASKLWYISTIQCLLNQIRNKIIYDYSSSVQFNLSYDVASGSEITPCNKIDKTLVVYRFTGNVMTSITTLRT